jgi:hypothetical protein
VKVEVLELDINVLPLPQNIWFALRRRATIKTVRQLCEKTSKDLLKIRGIGPGAIKTIRIELQVIGCDLAEYGGFRSELAHKWLLPGNTEPSVFARVKPTQEEQLEYHSPYEVVADQCLGRRKLKLM